MSESDCDNFREDYLLRGALGWQKQKRATASRFGDSAKEYFGNRLKRLKRNAEVVDALAEVMKSQFGEHCRLRSISGGVVRIEVDPGPYMHEMRLMSGELTELLKNKCPRAGLRSVSITAKGSDTSF